MAFVAGFELLRDCIVQELRDWYSQPSGDLAWMETTPEYEQRVIARAKDIVEASLGWLREKNVLTEDEIHDFGRLRKKRNDVVHEFESYLTDKDRSDFVAEFSLLVDLTRKVELWWLKNAHIPLSVVVNEAETDKQEIDWEAMTGFRETLVRWMALVATESLEISDTYLAKLIKGKTGTTTICLRENSARNRAASPSARGFVKDGLSRTDLSGVSPEFLRPPTDRTRMSVERCCRWSVSSAAQVRF